jgi:hypothetical protein
LYAEKYGCIPCNKIHERNKRRGQSNRAALEVELVIRWAMVQLEPTRRLVVSEEKVIDLYHLVWEDDRWKIEAIRQLSPGAQGQIVFSQDLSADKSVLPDALIQTLELW